MHLDTKRYQKMSKGVKIPEQAKQGKIRQNKPFKYQKASKDTGTGKRML